MVVNRGRANPTATTQNTCPVADATSRNSVCAACSRIAGQAMALLVAGGSNECGGERCVTTGGAAAQCQPRIPDLQVGMA